MALSPRDKRAVTVLGGVAGLALVAFLLMNVLGGGGGEEAASSPPVAPTGGSTTAPSPTASPSTPRETLPPVVLAGARDPFSPPPVFAASPSGGVSPSGTSTAVPSGTGTPTSTVSPTASPTSPGGGASSSMGGHTVVLVDIFDSGTKAQIEVDGTVYTVNEGDDFDDNFRLASISGSCVQVQFGDEASTICLNPQK
jgi:hypothetical protein